MNSNAPVKNISHQMGNIIVNVATTFFAKIPKRSKFHLNGIQRDNHYVHIIKINYHFNHY